MDVLLLVALCVLIIAATIDVIPHALLRVVWLLLALLLIVAIVRWVPA